MQNAQDQYMETPYRPMEYDQAADKNATIRRTAALAVLVLVVGAVVGLGSAWLTGRFAAGAPVNASSGIVATATPSADTAAPAATSPAAANPAPVTPASSTGGSAGSGASSGSGEPEHVVDNTPPATPKQLSPSDGVNVADTGVQVALKWSKVTDPSGVRYRVQLQQWVGGGAGWQTYKLVKGLALTHYTLPVGAMRVRWRVIAVDLAGNVGEPTPWRAIDPVSTLVLLQDKKWLLAEISDGMGGMLDPLDGTHANLRFNSSTNSVGGNTGVNAFGAPYTAGEDGTIHIGTITTTMMAGSPDAMKQEMLLKSAMTSAAKWQLTNNYRTLRLLTAGGEELAAFSR